MFNVNMDSLSLKLPCWRNKTASCCPEPNQMWPRLVNVTERWQQPYPHFKFGPPHAVHQALRIVHRMRHVKLNSYWIPCDAKVSQAVVLQIWLTLNYGISEVMSPFALYCIPLAKRVQNDLEQISKTTYVCLCHIFPGLKYDTGTVHCMCRALMLSHCTPSLVYYTSLTRNRAVSNRNCNTTEPTPMSFASFFTKITKLKNRCPSSHENSLLVHVPGTPMKEVLCMIMHEV